MAKVLIVDDEVEVRQFLSRSLSECGHAIREASDGSEALERLAAEHHDLVITDLLMPVMDGFELALRIRANPDHATTKVIFFTGRASPRQIQAMAETAGVAQIVTKPATIDEVQEAVDAALHRRHLPEQIAAPEFTTKQHQALIDELSQAERAQQGAERARFASEHRLRLLFVHSLDAMLLVSDDGHCLDANPAASELLGYHHDELTKLSIWDLTPPHATAGREHWGQFLAAGRLRGEYQLRHHDGTLREVEFSAIANLESGVHLMTLRDITERKQREEMVRESEECHRLLFNRSPMPMWVYDAETLRFVAVNAAALRQYGYTREEFLAMTLQQIDSEEKIPAVIESSAALTEEQPVRSRATHRKKDGSRIVVENFSQPLVLHGRAVRTVVILNSEK